MELELKLELKLKLKLAVGGGGRTSRATAGQQETERFPQHEKRRQQSEGFVELGRCEASCGNGGLGGGGDRENGHDEKAREVMSRGIGF